LVIHLIRHAHAGSRGAWTGDDLDRPLSDRGRAQARELAGAMADAPVDAVWSSPARRCTETVGPLALQHGTEVRSDPVLAEGRDSYEALAFLLALARTAAGDVVVCGHGDMIPNIVGTLVAEGVPVEDNADPRVAKKGSVWRLEVVDGAVTAASYLPVAG
jgi:broad specificity phosphatase PhoE